MQMLCLMASCANANGTIIILEIGQKRCLDLQLSGAEKDIFPPIRLKFICKNYLFADRSNGYWIFVVGENTSLNH
jgi:hypothetical protein